VAPALVKSSSDGDVEADTAVSTKSAGWLGLTAFGEALGITNASAKSAATSGGGSGNHAHLAARDTQSPTKEITAQTSPSASAGNSPYPGSSGARSTGSPLTLAARSISRDEARTQLSADASGADISFAPAPTTTFTQKLFFKQGDDLRTDQLILNLFTLMDSLLKKVNLDLKMRMYGVLATRAKVGIMEYVDHSMPVQAILDKYGSIRNYFAVKNPWDGVLAPAPTPTALSAPASEAPAEQSSPSTPASGKSQNAFGMIGGGMFSSACISGLGAYVGRDMRDLLGGSICMYACTYVPSNPKPFASCPQLSTTSAASAMPLPAAQPTWESTLGPHRSPCLLPCRQRPPQQRLLTKRQVPEYTPKS